MFLGLRWGTCKGHVPMHFHFCWFCHMRKKSLSSKQRVRELAFGILRCTGQKAEMYGSVFCLDLHFLSLYSDVFNMFFCKCQVRYFFVSSFPSLWLCPLCLAGLLFFPSVWLLCNVTAVLGCRIFSRGGRTCMTEGFQCVSRSVFWIRICLSVCISDLRFVFLPIDGIFTLSM